MSIAKLMTLRLHLKKRLEMKYLKEEVHFLTATESVRKLAQDLIKIISLVWFLHATVVFV